MFLQIMRGFCDEINSYYTYLPLLCYASGILPHQVKQEAAGHVALCRWFWTEDIVLYISCSNTLLYVFCKAWLLESQSLPL